MKRLSFFLSGNIVVVLTLSAVSALPGSNATDQPKITRSQLAAEYAQIEQGFRRNDPSPWIERLSPDFHLILFNGQKQNREWVVNYVRNNAKAFRVLKLTIRIKGLDTKQGNLTAIVEQKSVRSFTDENGRPHRLEVGALQRETWEQTPDGWRLRVVQEWKLLYLRKH